MSKEKHNTPRKKKKDNLFNRIIAWLHLWPSIVSGLVLVFVCLTGTLIVFGDEIMYISTVTHNFSGYYIIDITGGKSKYVSPQNTKRISISVIQQNMKAS